MNALLNNFKQNITSLSHLVGTIVVASAVEQVVALLLSFIHCLLFLPLSVGIRVRSLFCFAVLFVLSSFAIISLGKRGLASLLSLCSEFMLLLSIFDYSSRCHGLVYWM